jgi:NNMT/PNMT/TEMT family
VLLVLLLNAHTPNSRRVAHAHEGALGDGASSDCVHQEEEEECVHSADERAHSQGERGLEEEIGTGVRMGEDYHRHFHVPSYLSAYYQSAEGSVEEGNLLDFFLGQYYRFFDEYVGMFALPNSAPHSVLPNTWLDFGSGPSLWHLVAARGRLDHITLCDYAQPNVNYLRRWKSQAASTQAPGGEKSAPAHGDHDWLSFYTSAIQRHESERFANEEVARAEAQRRLDLLRGRAVREVLQCDVHQPKPLGVHWDRNRRFDLVTSNLCVEAACRTRKEYRRAIKHLTSLVQNGGTLVLAAVAGESFYRVGEQRFHCLAIDEELVRTTLEEVGFQRVHIERLSAPSSSSGEASDFDELMFVVANPLWIA